MFVDIFHFSSSTFSDPLKNENSYSTETDTMYSVLDNGRPDVDYFLVGIDVNTGATKSAVFLNEAVWPWCLGYVNDN